MGYSNFIKVLKMTDNKFYTQEKITKIEDGLEPDSFRDELRAIHLKYNFFPVEILLSKCKGLLHSLLDKRDEIRNLEVNLINQSINKLLKDKNKQKDKSLLDLDTQNKDFLSKNISKNIELQINNNSIKAKDSSINDLSNIEQELNEIKEKFRLEVDEIDSNYESYITGENSGLNFLERIIEKKEIYHSIFKEFYTNLLSLNEGFKVVYNINNPLPNIDSSNLLNDYYKWLTDSIIELNNIVQYEQETELIISLKNGVFNEAGLIAGSNILNFNEQITAGLLHFRLPATILNKNNVRLRSLALLTNLGDSNTWFSNEVFSFDIKLPNQTDSLGNTKTFPKLKINALHYHKSNFIYKNDNTSLININPFANDDWQISIPTRGCFNFDATIPKTQIRDIFLVLRVAYTD